MAPGGVASPERGAWQLPAAGGGSPRMDPRNLEKARAFLALPRIALVGLSRDDKDFSRMVFRELVKRGIDVVPVNPGAAELEGRPCFPRLADVRPPVQGALVMT